MRTMHRAAVLMLAMLAYSCVGKPRGATLKPWLQDSMYRDDSAGKDEGIFLFVFTFVRKLVTQKIHIQIFNFC